MWSLQLNMSVKTFVKKKGHPEIYYVLDTHRVPCKSKEADVYFILFPQYFTSRGY